MCRGWFFVDFVSILPYDIFSRYMETVAKGANFDYELLTYFRMFRLLRLIKIFNKVSERDGERE